MQWLEKDFLGYLKEWETSVMGEKNSKESRVEKDEKRRKLLSVQTRTGIICTGTRCMYMYK